MGRAKRIRAVELTKEAFAPFGSVIEKDGAENFPINNDNCQRYHNLAKADVTGKDGAVGISIFSAKPYALPVRLSMVERHPLGSQAFYPLYGRSWLVIACEDSSDGPGNPKAFVANRDQGVSFNRGVWHGVLTPLGIQSDFIVVDRVGEGDNQEEFYFDKPFEVTL